MDRVSTGTVVDPAQDASIGDLLASALQVHRSGQFDDARTLYEQVVARDPTLPDGWHFLGLLQYQTGNKDQGIAALERALELSPDYADAHANLANMLVMREQFARAEAHLERALATAPDALPPRITLALIRRHSGRPDEAEALLRPALESNPDNVAVRFGIANTLMALGRVQEALDHVLRAIALDGGIADMHRLQAYALAKLGRLDEAMALYRKRIEDAPDDAEARHLLAACGGAEVPIRASDEYLRFTFDNFASTFEAQLSGLSYRGPQQIRAAVEQCLPPPAAALDVLDAGCGTGLVGAQLKPWSARLAGVDLSPGMLERAKARGIYDTLVEGELTAFLAAHPACYHLIVSADTLIYFGALDEFTARAYAALRHGGWLVFTVEDGADQPEEYRLQFHGRYAHRADYVERMLENAGFAEIRIAKAVVRNETGVPVAGLVFAANRDDR